MTGILNLISDALIRLDFTRPKVYIDLFIALFLIVSFLVYLRRFPVFRVVMGTFFMFACSVFFFWTGFIFVSLVFGIASNLILISLPLIFAPEIRHYLEKLGRFSFLRFPTLTNNKRKSSFIHNLVDSVFELAEKKIGGIIVLQRQTGLGETIETGTRIDARYGSKLIQNIFFPKSPLHDGAVVVQGDRIVAAGCLLPVHSEVKLAPQFGLRHRASISITHDTDAVVVVVSEQRGEVSLTENNKIFPNLDRIELTNKLHQLLKVKA